MRLTEPIMDEERARVPEAQRMSVIALASPWIQP